ncbi:MAG TPA: YfcC family protein, partial [Cytophagales bacterium]
IGKPLSVPGTYRPLPQNGQGVMAVLEAPLKGLYDTVDIIVFLFVIGGFINVFIATGALEAGLLALSTRMKGREGWLIIVLTFLFAFGGGSFGMAEEGMAFYPVLVPLFLAAGYDLLVPVAVIFGGTQLGTLVSFSNPFSTIIASKMIGVNWGEGIPGRLLLFLLATLFFTGYLLRYAGRVRQHPEASLVRRFDGAVPPPFATLTARDSPAPLGRTHGMLLLIFLATFLVMIGGVVFGHWWLPEMSVVFLVSAVGSGLLARMPEKAFMAQFITGAQGLLGVALIIGPARGVSIILDNGNIRDTLIFNAAQGIAGTPPGVLVLLLLVFYLLFSLFIASTSGMAVVTMPIIGSVALVTGVPGTETVNAYLFGMGIMGFVAPTGLILPSLALANVSLRAWWHFIRPVLLVLLVLCGLFLVGGVYL